MLGPGSWFTSVMPHLLVPDLADALVATPARRLLNLNLEVHTGETRDFRAEDHLASFAANAPELRLDVVLADPSVVDDDGVAAGGRGRARRRARRLDRGGQGTRCARPAAAGGGLRDVIA